MRPLKAPRKYTPFPHTTLFRASAREELTREGSARSNVFSSKQPGSNPGSLEEKSMSPLQRRCLCSTAIPIALGFGFAAVPASGTGLTAVAHAQIGRAHV